jgi:sulfoxide reductase heme-binding subunit YedZ
MLYRIAAWWQKTSELSTLSLLALTVLVAALTLVGEAVGIGLSFQVSPMLVLGSAFDFDIGIRPGWQVLGAGLAVVVLGVVRSRWNRRAVRTSLRQVKAET